MILTQRKITDTMTKLPAKERMEHLEKIENTTRGELKEVKRKPIEEVENKETWKEWKSYNQKSYDPNIKVINYDIKKETRLTTT